MRKVISTMMMVLVAVVAFAQAPNQVQGVEYPGWKKDLDFLLNDEVQPRLSKKDAVVINDWYRFVDDWRALMGGFNGSNTFFSIFPDTFVKNLSVDETNNTARTSWQGWNSIGQMFDPNDDNWGDADLANLRDWRSYKVDSIFFTYGYFRSSNSDIVDTLIIQVYNESQITDGSFTLSSGVSQFGTVGYDQAKGIGANFTQTFKVLLTENDSNMLTPEGTFRGKSLAVGLETPLIVPANGACAVTITYKPGVEYSFGDTLFFASALTDFGVKAPVKKINRFGLLAAVQDLGYTPLQSQNNGLFIVRWNRYDDPFTGGSAFMNNKYYPNLFGSGNSQVGYYPYIAFKVQAEYDSGIEDATLENGFGLGKVYPNPANQNSQMNVSFAVNSQEKVEIAIYDLTGKKVQTITHAVYEKGEHNATFEATDLTPGMYIYTMTAGEFSTSKKLNIVK